MKVKVKIFEKDSNVKEDEEKKFVIRFIKLCGNIQDYKELIENIIAFSEEIIIVDEEWLNKIGEFKKKIWLWCYYILLFLNNPIFLILF